MIKQNKFKLIITSIITILPMVAGVILWDKLPQEIPTHFGIDGTPDQYSSKPFAVFFLPLFLLFIHWLGIFATSIDPKKKNVTKKPFTLVVMVCPLLSIVLHTITYSMALGVEINVPTIMCSLMGVLLVIIGNYLPKCRQNYTIGLKFPWTLNDEENWDKTHRFSGILWTIAGFVVLATSFLGSFILFISTIIVMVITPVIYSFILHKKKEK